MFFLVFFLAFDFLLYICKSCGCCLPYRQCGPVRRIVQPRLVGHDSKASSTSSSGEQKTGHPRVGHTNDQILTAAAAASAAVAATQPFLKVKHCWTPL